MTRFLRLIIVNHSLAPTTLSPRERQNTETFQVCDNLGVCTGEERKEQIMIGVEELEKVCNVQVVDDH